MKSEKVLMGIKLFRIFTTHNRWTYLALSLLFLLLIGFSILKENELTEKDTIVFINDNVADLEQLIHGAGNAEVIVLNHKTDGIEKVSKILAEKQNLKSLHIVSHGKPGGFALGNTYVTSHNIPLFKTYFESWNAAFQDNADLLLYSCRVVSGKYGEKVVRLMHEATGLDVAASENHTGNFAAGGDWDLEHRLGDISTDLIFDRKTRVNYSQVLTTGGPDTFGYTFIDSDETGGTVAFDDISGTGSAMNLGDEGEGNVTASFSFNFYGTTSSDFRVAANGGIFFNATAGSLGFTNGTFPNAVGNLIAPFWDDLNSNAGGQIYYEEKGTSPNRRLIVQWENVPHYNTFDAEGATFQVIFYETSNDIDFVYTDTNFGNGFYNNGASATIGINQDGTDALQYSNNTASLNGISSIRYSFPPDMVYTSSTVTQNTSDVSSNATDQQIIGLQVVTTNNGNPLDITSFNFNTTGTTNAGNDISNAKVYYTGTSGTFATTTQVGSTIASPNGNFTVTGTQALSSGTNYFWLTYDINLTATDGNLVDAQATQITVDGSNYTPSTTSPAGSRTILAPTYATLPYTTGFESGSFDNSWTSTSSNVLGRVQITTANTPNNGTYHMTMDVNAAGTFNTNEAWLHLDLSGQTQVDLEFFWKEFGDETHTLDGVYFSDDGGTSFTKVFDLNGNGGAWEQENLDVDALATANALSLTSTFVIKFQQYDNFAITDDGFAFDDISVTVPVMTFSSSTATQNNTSTVFKSTTDQEIIGLEIVTIGSLNAIDVTSFNFNTTGSTNASNDISNAKLYYTGTSGTFATTTQVGSTVGSPNGSFTITGTQTLSEGTNYFWLTYDVNAGSVESNVIDAQATQITVDGANYTPATTSPAGTRTIISPPVYASFPYYTSFETGFFENEWVTSTSNSNGRVQVTTGNNPRNGNYHMTLDVSVTGTLTESRADLYIDLSGQTQVEMEFYMIEYGEEDHGIEGIYFSDDGGNNFTYVYQIDPGDYFANDYNRIVLDLDALAAANALSLNSTFVIRFLQYDDFSIANDGMGFDDIIIRTPPCDNPTYATLPYYEGFESGYLDSEWCTTFPGGVNNTSVSKEYNPYIGDFHLIMESLVDGVYATNEALLHLDLSGETQVEMSLYYKEYDDEDDNVDGIYFSDDGGSSFTLVNEIDGDLTTDDTWTNLVLDVDALATANGLSLNSTFVIKILQYDNSYIPFDGFAYDEIQVYSNATNWIGGTSTAWNTAANWSNGVPDCSTLVTIPDVSGASGNFPLLGAGANANVGDIIIQAGASVTVNNGFTINVCGNWNNYGSAALGLGTVVFQGTNIQEIVGANTFQNFTVNNNGSFIRLVDDQTINGALTLTDGIIDTNFNVLTLGTAATTSGASNASFVDGPLSKLGNADFEFPVGDGTTWAPIAVENLTGDAATVFTAEYFETQYADTDNLRASDPNGDLNNVSIKEYWDLDNSGTASSADVTLYWKDQNGSGINSFTDLQISHYSGTEWENLGQSAIASSDPGWIRVTGVSSFSPFSFGSADGSNPLPVEFVSFTATEENKTVVLDWQTASELNNDFFEVQRSEDGEDWEVIGQVEGNGTINEIVDYSFVDERPLYGTSYYRLRQVDFDGQFDYSSVQSVSLTMDNDHIEVSIYPNPTSEDDINVRLLSPNRRNKVKLKMVDISGKIYLEQTVEAEKFSQDLKLIPDRKLTSGIYILEIQQDQMVSKHKIIIL